MDHLDGEIQRKGCLRQMTVIDDRSQIGQPALVLYFLQKSTCSQPAGWQTARLLLYSKDQELLL